MLLFTGIFIAALATGAFFFAGLYYSVGKMMRSSNPAAWALVGFLVRCAVTLGIFYWLGNGQLARLLVCLAGFITARMLVTRLLPKKEHYAVKS